MVGNVDGQLAIFRGDTDTKPWKKCLDLGMVVIIIHNTIQYRTIVGIIIYMGASL